MASKEDCRKFWLCKEEEEGSRVLEVIWVVVKIKVIMRILMMICKEEEEGSRVLEVIWVVVKMRLIMRIVMMICKEEEESNRVLVVGILRCCL